MLVIDKCRPV